MKTEEREKARALRRDEGRSVKEIAKLLSVSRSSVSLWVRDIQLSEEQLEALRQRNPLYNRQLAGSGTNVAHGRRRRSRAQEEGRALARSGDPLHLAGCMLYWAEGAKGRTQVRFSNSDPELVRLFVAFLRRYFDLADEEIHVKCYLFADHADRQWAIEQFWLDVLQLPRPCLWKSIVNVYSKHSLKKRKNKLQYGTCQVVVCRTSVVQSIYGAIQEYAGFEREEWLG